MLMNSRIQQLFASAAAVLAAFLLLASPATAQEAAPQIIPIDQIKPGMKGVMRTILAGDKVETIELEVLGILPNNGPGDALSWLRAFDWTRESVAALAGR